MLSYMCIDGLVEVLVFLDELLHVVCLSVVGRVVGGLQERLASRHPALGLFTVAVEQLQFQILV